MLGAGFQLTQLQRAQNDVACGRSIQTKKPENGSTLKKLHVSETSSCNLERFLESVTPFVRTHYLSKVCFNISSQYHFQNTQTFRLFMGLA